MKSELRDAIREGNLPGVKLLVEGRASIAGTRVEWSALELAVITGDIAIVKWLLEYGGADIMDTTSGGRTVWELLEDHFYFARMRLELGDRVGVDLPPSLLRAMVLQSAPLADLLTRMTRPHSIRAWRRKEHGYELDSRHTSHGGEPSLTITHR
jgi:ankyrin repeat protein